MRQSKQILTRDVLSTPSAEGFSVPVPVLFLRSALSWERSIFDGVGDVSTIPWTHPAKSNSFADESVAACVFTQYIIEG